MNEINPTASFNIIKNFEEKSVDKDKALADDKTIILRCLRDENLNLRESESRISPNVSKKNNFEKEKNFSILKQEENLLIARTNNKYSNNTQNNIDDADNAKTSQLAEASKSNKDELINNNRAEIPTTPAPIDIEKVQKPPKETLSNIEYKGDKSYKLYFKFIFP